MITYRELAPVPELSVAVQGIWLLEGSDLGPFEPDPVLPDGRPELILHFGEPFERIADGGEPVRQPLLMFAGQLTSQLLLRPTGRTAIVGVRFHPHGAPSVLPTPQDDLVGNPLDLGSVSAVLARELAAIEFSGDLDRAAAAVQRVLVRRMTPSRVDDRIRFAVHLIERTRGQASVETIARAVNITRRHLERRFLADVGLTPKRLGRLARFQHALRILEDRDSPRPGVETAMASGYSDQSHFIREFRELAGCSPSQHVLRRAALTGFFVNGGQGSAVRAG